MSRTDLINYILANDEQYTMEELLSYRYDELVVIKVRVELEKSERKNESENKTKRSSNAN